MSDKPLSFSQALNDSGVKPLEYCRAVERLSGKKLSPTMPSRWLSGMHEAPPAAIALAVLIGRLPETDRQKLTEAPPRKPYGSGNE